MVVRMIEILLEYSCFILCIHKLVKRKVVLEKYAIFLLGLEMVCMLAISKSILPPNYKVLLHIGFMIYVKVRFDFLWRKVFIVYGKMLVVIMTLQMFFYYMIKLIRLNLIDEELYGCVINGIIIFCLCIWKEEYKQDAIRKLKNRKGIFFGIVFAGLICHILYLYEKSYRVEFNIAMQFLLESIGLSITAMLWMNAENENKNKTRELEMYEMYNHVFEEAVLTIRMRQHEFENHINAIKCMNYTISEHDELITAQEEYCEMILKDNKINKLLYMNFEPVIIGFLYLKISSAYEKGIMTEYDIESVDIKEHISILDFVEVMGILLDNAIEALEYQEEKRVVIKMYINGERLCVEVANRSRVFLNNEIEKFCEYGYSSKGSNRGIGLSRVKEIVHKYRGIFQIQNRIYGDKNYVNFKIML